MSQSRLRPAARWRLALVTKLALGLVAWWLLWLVLACLLYRGLSLKAFTLVLLSLVGFCLGGQMKSSRRPERGSGPSFSVAVPRWILSGIMAYQVLVCATAVVLLGNLTTEFRSTYYEGGVHGGSLAFVLYEQLYCSHGDLRYRRLGVSARQGNARGSHTQ